MAYIRVHSFTQQFARFTEPHNANEHKLPSKFYLRNWSVTQIKIYLTGSKLQICCHWSRKFESAHFLIWWENQCIKLKTMSSHRGGRKHVSIGYEDEDAPAKGELRKTPSKLVPRVPVS